MKSDHPAGPWENVLKRPLLSKELGQQLQPPTQIRDPCVFADDDGSQYIVFGTFEYYIAKLGEDMVSLAEYPQHLTVNNPTGPYGSKTDDKPFLHRYRDTYYLSWGCFYATASSPYGPFEYVGSAVDTAHIAPDFRLNDTAGPWYSHGDYKDRHGSFFTSPHGQWYFSTNDQSHSLDVAHRNYFRDTVLAYVHYLPNGSIAPVEINAQGVNSHAVGARIPAEHYFAVEGAAEKVYDEGGVVGGEGGGGRFAVRLGRGGKARYTHVGVRSGVRLKVELLARLEGEGSGEAAVEVAMVSGDGVLVARAVVAVGREKYHSHVADVEVVGSGAGALQVGDGGEVVVVVGLVEGDGRDGGSAAVFVRGRKVQEPQQNIGVARVLLDELRVGISV